MRKHTHTHTDQRRYSCVAVDQGQTGQADDDVAQGGREEGGDFAVFMVAQCQDALQALHQLRHDLTCPPLTHIWKTHTHNRDYPTCISNKQLKLHVQISSGTVF